MATTVVFLLGSLLREKRTFVLKLKELIITIHHLRAQYTMVLGDFFLMMSVFVFSVFLSMRIVASVQLFLDQTSRLICSIDS